MTTPRKLEPGDTLGRYRIVRRLGAGAMGEVFLAEDPNIERQLAIKTVLFEGTSAKLIAERKERILREAKAAGRLIHPNVVTLFDADEQEGMIYLAFEYVAGHDLQTRMLLDPPVTLRDALRIVRQTSDALAAAHTQGIVHRDIKPTNILVNLDGNAKIADFGIAKITDQQSDLTQTGTVIGSPQYMAPEQIKGEPLDGRCDQFSLGTLFYEMLTLDQPFAGDTISTVIYQILHKDPPDLSARRPDLPPALLGLVGRMMEKQREDRFPQLADVAEEIRHVERELPRDLLDDAVWGPSTDDKTVTIDTSEALTIASDDRGIAAPESAAPPPPESPSASSAPPAASDSGTSAGAGVPPPPPGASSPPPPSPTTDASTPVSAPPPASPPPQPPTSAGSASPAMGSAAASRSGSRIPVWVVLAAVVVGLVVAGFAVTRVWRALSSGDAAPTSEVADAETDRLDTDEMTDPDADRDPRAERRSARDLSSLEADSDRGRTTDTDTATVGPGVDVEARPEPSTEEAQPATSERDRPPATTTAARATRDDPPRATTSAPATTSIRATTSARATSPAPDRPTESDPPAADDITADDVAEEAEEADEAGGYSGPVDLRMQTGRRLVLSSEPKGENVFVQIRGPRDDRFISVGSVDEYAKAADPLVLPGTGTFYVRLRSEGYRDWVLEARVGEGAATRTIDVALSRAGAPRTPPRTVTVGEAIAFEDGRRRTEVYVDGRRRGTLADFRGDGDDDWLVLSPGTHDLLLLGRGDRRIRLQVVVDPSAPEKRQKLSRVD